MAQEMPKEVDVNSATVENTTQIYVVGKSDKCFLKGTSVDTSDWQ